MTFKKSSIFILITVLAVLLLSACGTEAPAATTAAGDAQAVPAQTSAAQTVSAQPERTAEYYGQVQSIIGNEVTLAIAESTATADLTDEEKAQRKAEMQALSQEERQKLKSEQTKFTGETVTVIIPVGTPIITTDGSGTQNLLEVTLADLNESKFLRIWTEKGETGDSVTAEYVRVMQSQ